MPRQRVIHPEFWTDGKMLKLPLRTRLFYIGLWQFADDYGHLEDESEQLQVLIFPGGCEPVTPEETSMMITELCACHRLFRYEVDGKKCLAISFWDRWQHIEKRSRARLPSPPGIEPSTSAPSVGDPSPISRGALPDPSPTPPRPLPDPSVSPLPLIGIGTGTGTGTGIRNKEGVVKGGMRKQVPPDPRVKEIIILLEEERGYASSCVGAEAKALKWMLAHGSSPEEILSCWRGMLQETYWQEKPIHMMSVAKEIGEWKKRGRRARVESPPSLRSRRDVEKKVYSPGDRIEQYVAPDGTVRSR